jgi:glutaconate CoA-transferase subunit B
MNYTPQELMVAAAAREIHDGEIVFVGMRLPLIAFALARETHAPTAVGLFELGVVREAPAPELLYTMGDPPNIAGATWCAHMIDLMGLMQAGAVHAGFIGGAEIDRYGNLNTSYIGTPQAPQVKLPGSGGAADIASLAQRLLIIMPHERRRFVERVGYITSPGYGDGPGWRERVGLLRGGPAAVITTLGVLGFDPATREAILRSYHPGQSVESLRTNTGWQLQIAPDVHETPAPTTAELVIIRRYDPAGFWTR